MEPGSYTLRPTQWLTTMIAARPNFSNVVTQSLYFADELEQPDPRLVMNDPHAAWSIPTEEDIATMRACVEPCSIDATPACEAQYWDKEKYRFSAAATAIAFLNSVSTETRLQIRRQVLSEDRMAVAWPECHGQLLIILCQENPNLRIKRRVNLWHCILPAALAPPYTAARNEHRIHDSISSGNVSSGYPGCGGVADWIMEASRLPAQGLPSNSFTLVIDVEPIPTASTRVFDVLQRDAVWQLAYEGCVNDPSIWPTPPGWLQIRESKAFIMKGFPEALGDIS
jgi:hypothetical protein